MSVSPKPFPIKARATLRPTVRREQDHVTRNVTVRATCGEGGGHVVPLARARVCVAYLHCLLPPQVPVLARGAEAEPSPGKAVRSEVSGAT